jgi:hypothetical protein
VSLVVQPEQYQADLLRHFPAATCTSGDGGAVNSLRYYSLVTFPRP